MKKLKVMALTLAASVMLMGAGYAYWSDSVNITNTVKTGTLDVAFDQSLTEVEITDRLGNDVDDLNYAAGTIQYSNGGDKATVTVTDLYPGATFSVQLKIDNNSTMPVILKDLASDGIKFKPVDMELGEFLTYFSPIPGTFTVDDVPLEVGTPEIGVGESVDVEYKWTATENIAQGATYSLSYDPEFEQYNAE